VVEIETSVSSFKKVTIVFDYRIYRKDDRSLLVSGYTKHGFIDLEGKIVKIPDFIHEKIASLMEEGAAE
jgi:acyl-CoA thioesterase FadM